MIRFIKMHGAGNDYVFVDCRQQHITEPAALARTVSDRHRGIGSDGLVLLLPSCCADLAMRIFNADGSEAEMCGNAARCAARYAWEQKWVACSPLRLETRCGIRTLWQREDGRITVSMGEPVLFPEKRPCYKNRPFCCVSVGNPHAVLLAADVRSFPLREASAAVFPQGSCNTEIVQVLSPNRLRVRVWERGSGETMACGTGACASVVAAIQQGVCCRDTDIAVEMPGGVLTVRWQTDNSLLLTGDAVFAFRGEWE